MLALVAAALAVYTWRAIQDSDWAEPVWRYILFEGLPGTLKVSAVAVVGSALIGIMFGTLMTIKLLPLQALIRLYIEVFRGLPILVTVFIVYFGLPSVWTQPRVRGAHGSLDRADPLGERAGGRGDARRRRLDPARAARGRRRRSASAGSAGTGS